jgi:nucleotide-binding universal stress UspA family protein
MKILVPLDGSLPAEAALSKAVALAQQNGDAVRLVLVRAVDPTSLPAGFSTAQVAAIEAAAAYLRKIAAQLRRERFPIDRSVWYAAAGPAIVEAARAAKPDMIVMASSDPARRLPEPVSEFVRRRTEVPIVLVPFFDESLSGEQRWCDRGGAATPLRGTGRRRMPSTHAAARRETV